MKPLFTPLFFLFCSILFAQTPASSADAIVNSMDAFEQMQEASMVKNIPFENIGPKVMSGRVVALAVNPENPAEFYVAYASGGVWHTTTNGISFDPISDNAPIKT